jgi:flagellar assembly protein FliH
LSNIFKLISVRNIPIVIKAPVYDVPKVSEPDPVEPDHSEAATAAAMLLDTVGTGTLVEAHQKAADITETAKQEAEAMIAAATEQANQLKLDAYDQGYREGHRDGLEQARQAIVDATNRAEQVTAAAAVEAAETLLASERQMVDIALAVARKILNREIALNVDTVLPIVAATLEKVRDQDLVTVRVSPEDLDQVTGAKQQFQSQLTQDATLSVIDDAGLKSGDCVIETAFGVIDARIDSQFEAIKSSLKEAANE